MHDISKRQLLLTGENWSVSDNPLDGLRIVRNKQDNEILFDLSLVEEMDDDEYVFDILTTFLGNTPKELNDLKNACMVENLDIVHGIAHKIKSSAGLLQAIPFLNVLIKIELLAKAGEGSELANVIKNANAEYKKIEIPLKRHLANLGKALRGS